MRTVADLTPAERAKEVESAIALVEASVVTMRRRPAVYAQIALQTALVEWEVAEESFAFLEDRYIDHLSALDPRLASAYKEIEAYADAHGLDLEACRHPTAAYLRKLDRVQSWQARYALLPLLNNRTEEKANAVVMEVEYWLALAEKNDDLKGAWLPFADEVSAVLRKDYPEQSARLTAVVVAYCDKVLGS